MNLLGILSELQGEKEQLERAIQILERLGSSPLTSKGPRDAGEPRRRRPFSAESRRKMAEAQKRRWAAKRAESTNGD